MLPADTDPSNDLELEASEQLPFLNNMPKPEIAAALIACLKEHTCMTQWWADFLDTEEARLIID